jgi:hypothetical protein
MKTLHLRRKARQLFNNDLAPVHTNQHNQRQWVRSIIRLGDKWLMFKPMGRLDETKGHS